MCILVGTFLLTSYHHVSHTCKTFAVCSGTQLIGGCYSNALPNWGSRPNPTSELTRQWIEMSVFLNAVFAVLLPVFAVAVLNISLVRLLKKRNTQELLVHTVNTNPSTRHEQERKMTHTVLAIVTCFSLTQGPSALVFIYQLLYPSSRSGFLRSQSKSQVTQKTSLMYSPSSRVRSSTESEMILMKKRSRS
ncbi:hypothetical protein OSTOST_12033, partial [Ostertagia ostertagi]